MTQFRYTLYDGRLDPAAEAFFSHYHIEKIIAAVQSPDVLKPEEERVCRFCQKRMPAVKFSSVAHIIPHQLGNESLVSDFECDSCNKKFGKYEDQLANFLGITRTLDKLKGKKGYPDFNSPGDEVKASVKDVMGLEDVVEIEVGKNLSINMETGQHNLSFRQKGYRPLSVFKALAHIGFCMMSEEDIQGYRECIKVLMLDKKKDMVCAGHPIFNVAFATVPRKHKTFAILYRRINPGLFPLHTLQIFTGNTIMQLAMPLQVDDNKNYSENFSHLFLPPGHFDGGESPDVNIRWNVRNMAGTETVQETSGLGFMIDPEALKNLVAMDKETGEIKDIPFDPTQIAKIIISTTDQRIRFPNPPKADGESDSLPSGE